MKLYKNKTGQWAVRYKDSRGNEHSRSLKTKNKADAESIVKEAGIEQMERAGQVAALTKEVVAKIQSGKRVTINEVNDEWGEHRRIYSASDNSIYTSDRLISAFARKYRITHMDEVSAETVSEFINGEGRITKGTRTQRLSVLRGLFDFATKRSYLLDDPTINVKVNVSKLSHKQKETKEKTPFTEVEFTAILGGATNDFMRTAIAISWYTGLRLGDICRLEWDSIGEDSIVVWTLKRDKRVEIPFAHPIIGGGILKIILGSIERLDDKYCFPKPRIIISDPRRRSNYSVQFSKLMKKLHMTGSFHCLRHSFVTRLAKAGMELEDIGKLVGHSDTKTTEIYNHD